VHPNTTKLYLFSPLIIVFSKVAAQKDISSAENAQNGADEKMFSQLFDGSGEYTIVYEDNEGYRMLVGDVPWK
jgi:auxin-responsive protein IAA